MSTEQLVARMKREILEDMQAGIVPVTVDSFSKLHDYVDANMYGGIDALDIDWNSDEGCALLNRAQNAVGQWLKNGGN